ncbi:MAG: hypothetical protein ACYCOU_00780 [Sulfobacillus sp.]
MEIVSVDRNLSGPGGGTTLVRKLHRWAPTYASLDFLARLGNPKRISETFVDEFIREEHYARTETRQLTSQELEELERFVCEISACPLAKSPDLIPDRRINRTTTTHY